MAKEELARKMPYSIEAEEAVLGCVLLNDDVAVKICGALNPDAFYSKTNKTIFETMQKINRKSKPIDYVTLISELEKDNLLDNVGGIDYVTSLTNIVPSASNYEHYMEIVKRDFVLRQLIKAGQDIVELGYTSDDSTQAMQKAEKLVFDISEKQNVSELTHISVPLEEVKNKFDAISQDKNALRGLSTGFYRLDKLTNGLQKGDLILLAARPGVGKTSLAMNIVVNSAIRSKAKCAVFSLEMPKTQIAQRAWCSTAYVDMSTALKGDLTFEDWKALLEASDKLCDTQIYIDDSSLTSHIDVLSKCRKLKREKGLDLVMIDYLQLMNSGNKKNEGNRVNEIGEITRNLKIAAKELDVPILLLSQLSRGVEAREDHRPMLSDLRESGSIEQDADIVMFIYNPDKYLKDDTSPKQGIVDLIVAKHRQGATDTIKLKFISQHTTFTNLTADAEAMSLEQNAPAEKEKVTQKKGSEFNPVSESDSAKDIPDDIGF